MIVKEEKSAKKEVIDFMHTEEVQQSEVHARAELYDWIRLLATLFVVLGHSAYLEIKTTYGMVDYDLPLSLAPAYNGILLSFFRLLSSWVYGFHMPLFFFLSGSVLGIKPLKSFDDFVFSKIHRLIIPYYLAGILFMFPVKLLGGFYSFASVRQAIVIFWNGGDSGHLWFLPSLFWCMLLFVIIFKALQRLNICSVWLVLIICEIISITYMFLPFDFLGMKQGLAYLFWFGLGFLFEKYRKKLTFKPLQSLSLCIMMGIFYAINMKYSLLDQFFTILLGIVFTIELSVAISPFLLLIERQYNYIWRLILRRLFDIYIFHDPLEYLVLKIFFDRKLLETNFGCYLYFFMRTIGVILISIVIGNFVECISVRIKKVATTQN